MPSCGKRVPDLDGDTTFYPNTDARLFKPNPWRFNGGLDVHAVLNEIQDHLRRGLHDSVTARRSNQGEEIVISPDLARREAHLDSFVRGNNVRTFGQKVEPVHEVIQKHPRPAKNHARSEGRSEALGHCNGISFRVDHVKVRGTLINPLARIAFHHFPGQLALRVALAAAHCCSVADASPLGGGIALGKQTGNRRIWGTGVRRAVGACEFYRLDEQMQIVRRIVSEFTQGVVFQYAQRLKILESGARRRRAVDVIPLIRSRNRGLPPHLKIRQIFFRD